MKLDTQHIEKYVQWLNTHQYSENVKKNYSYYIKKLQGLELDQSLIETLSEDGHRVFKSFLKTMIECLELDLKIPRKRGRSKPVSEASIVYYTQEEMNKIMEGVNDLKFKIMIKLMFECGLRISEVMDLKKSSFDVVNKRVKGIGKGNKPYNIKVWDISLPLVIHFLDTFEGDPFVFRWDGIKCQRHKALYEIKKIVGKILPYKKNKEIFCHAFRHSCGTSLKERGFDLMDIQKHLRHSQLETVTCYVAVDTKKLERRIEGNPI